MLKSSQVLIYYCISTIDSHVFVSLKELCVFVGEHAVIQVERVHQPLGNELMVCVTMILGGRDCESSDKE